jgi:hypothetical protein
VGNVDAWAIFPVGAEDTKDVWEIAQGSRFGWKPEHFAGGLGPFQAALSVRDALLKIDTVQAQVPRVHADANREVVRETSRRYACPEDSEKSPLVFPVAQRLPFLQALPEQGRLAPARLAAALHWSLPSVDAALVLSLSTGDVAEGQGPNGVEYGLRARGIFLREALATARNEGEDHCDLLADIAAYLRLRGIHVRVVAQEGGYLRPDGKFAWGGREYHIEVECSTLVTHFEQVARNLRKAFALGRRCLVVVESREGAELFARILSKEVREAELWREVGVMWRDGVESMVPYVAGPRKLWGFLPGGVDDEDDDTEFEGPTRVAEATLAAANDPHATDLARVFDHAKKLHVEGRALVTADDFDELLRPDDGHSLDRLRLGLALEALGVKSRRLRKDGRRVRQYDLNSLFPSDEPAHERAPADPVAGSATEQPKPQEHDDS